MVSARQKGGSHGIPEGERTSGTDARARACEQKNIFLKANELVLARKNVNRKKSVQIDAVPLELPLEKIIDTVSHEGERNVKAIEMIRAQELSGNSARIDIVPWRRTVGTIW